MEPVLPGGLVSILNIEKESLTVSSQSNGVGQVDGDPQCIVFGPGGLIA